MMTGGVTQWRLALLVPLVVVSVLAHLALGYAVYQIPLGSVDPAMLLADDQPIRIVRVPRDQIELGQANAEGLNDADSASDTDALSSEQLTDALLHLNPPPPPLSPALSNDDVLPDATDQAAQAGGDIATLAPTLDQLAFTDTDPWDVTDALPEIDLSSMSASLDVQTQVENTRPFARPNDVTSQDAARQLLATIGTGGSTGTSLASSPSANTTSASGNGVMNAGGVADANSQGLGMALPELAGPARPTQQPIDPLITATPLASNDLIDFAAVATDATMQIELPINLDEDFTFTLTTYRDPMVANGGYLRVDVEPRRSLRKLKTMPKDIVFLVDTSLSIPKAWMREIISGLSTALDNLNPGDRFNIVFFNETPRFFNNDGVVAFDAQSIAEARRFLSGAQRGGNTDVNQAMSRLLVRDVGQERVYNLVLISDGRPTRGVMDTRELIQMITRDNDLAASIHCVGVGRRQNHSLLEFLAFRNRGTATFVDDDEQAAMSIRDLVGRLRYPLLKDVNLSVAGIAMDGVYPKNPPDVLQGQPFAIYGRYTDADLRHGLTMRLIGLNNGKPFEFNYWGRFGMTQQGDAGLMGEWASHYLHALHNQLLTEGETPALRQKIEAVESKYGLDWSR